MDSIQNNILCNGCQACYNVCNNNAITMLADNEGFLRPIINKSLCVSCGKCLKVCPLNSTYNELKNNCFAAVNKDNGILEKSSSGGIFYLLAKTIIDKDGVVFGVEMDKELNVKHNYAQAINEVENFLGSKYVQSDVGKNYAIAKSFLEKEKTVLFSGTPCQIVALKNFLNKKYENLFCVEVACHGVSSLMMLKKYVAYRETQANSKAESIYFRNKSTGWKKFSLKMGFSNGTFFKSPLDKDLFLQAFLKNYSLRPSCYNCLMKNKGVADVTLADFWGIENLMPEMDNNRGVSLILLHNDKGEKLFNAIKNDIDYKHCAFEKAIVSNSAIINSVEMPKNRQSFFCDIDKLDFDKVVKKYCKKRFKLVKKVINKIKLILNKK